MSEPSRPSTTPCPTRFRLSDGSTMDGILHLLQDPSRPTGLTTVESLLDGPRTFLAVGQERGGSLLISRDAIRTLELAADSPGVSPIGDGASFDVVTLRLDSGEEVSGLLRAVARKGFERMSDVLNESGRFIVLGVGDRVVLVASKHVVRVSF